MSKKTILFDSYCGYSTSAVVENGKLTEFKFERNDRTSIIGNIYKGKVENVLPGMQAAFINCGLERNCYLAVDDIFPDAEKYDGDNSEIPSAPELNVGDEIMVQVVKAPVGKKGARVTVFPSFVGKQLIYMPRTPFVGVSRKIADEELRKNLLYSANRMKRKDEGVIFRTAAPYAKRNRLELELSYLRNLYLKVEHSFKEAKVGDLIYTDINLHMRVMRDTLDYDIEHIIVGSPKLEKIISGLVELYPVANRRPVILHNSDRDMFDEYGITEQIYEIISPRVQLDNGANIVIEKTEALTVVDVNTGKFTGEDSLEQTVYYTNILAAREIARQVRLRNIGGIVVVDFIDMTHPAHRKSLVEELERALKSDSSKCSVAPMSKFGLVEFTRKRTGSSPLSVMTKPCKHCKSGYVKAPRFAILGVRTQLLNLYPNAHGVIRVDISSELLNEFTDWEEIKEDLKSRLKGTEVYGVPHRTYSDEQINYRTGNDCFPLPDNAVKIV